MFTKNMILAQINSIFEGLGFRVVFRETYECGWDRLLNDCEYIPVVYTDDYIDYQVLYQNKNGERCTDISIVLYVGSTCAGFWPLSIFKETECNVKITSQGFDLLPPLVTKKINYKTRMSLYKSCLVFLSSLSENNALEINKISDIFVDKLGVSEWNCCLSAVCHSPQFRKDIYLSLDRPLDIIIGEFRRTCRDRIKQSSNLWTAEIVTSESSNLDSQWIAFKALHYKASGRITRSEDTWNFQLSSIKKGNAFLLILKGTQDNIVGGGLFQKSRDEGYYSVSAYDRELFNKPIAHLVQYFAIVKFKECGVKWYKIGAMKYPKNLPKPTPKELSLVDFKKQFSSHFFSNYLFDFTGF